MRKHAYLIIAHNNFKILEKLIFLLDDSRNDLYIHIDNKVKAFDFEYFEKLTKKSGIKIYRNINVFWGGTSQIDVELFLLKKAVPGKYDYYHLLSGVDLPLKSQDYIHNFFEENTGKEFIDFDEKFEQYIIEKRVKYYHIFIGRYRSTNLIYRYFVKGINKIGFKLQNILGVNKLIPGYVYKKGSQWFSITHNLALYILDQKEFIEKNYKYSFCADEIFVQSIVYNSNFLKKVYRNIENHNLAMRYIDWENGNPYIFKSNDFYRLLTTKALFARKFDCEYMDIVKLIIRHINKDTE